MKDSTIYVNIIQPGDILLFPTSLGIYDYVAQKLGKRVADILLWLSDNQYLHAEIIYDANVSLLATAYGTWFVEHQMSELKKLTIMRPKVGVDPEKVKQVIRELWNIPYDYTSLIRNGIVELGRRLGLDKLFQTALDTLKPYDTKNAMICSETVARVYEKLGIKVLDDKPEWVSPQDLRESPYLEIVYLSPYDKTHRK